MSEVRVGIVGFGFMGKTHLASYRTLGAKCRVVAVADAQIERAKAAAAGNLATTGGVDLTGIRTYHAAEELLADREIDLVSICTPTDTHKGLALATIAVGKHMLLEKPVAVASADVRAVATAVRAGLVAMPAMVMRFWPGWPWLREQIQAAHAGKGPWGRFVGATFQRLGTAPAWNADFYANAVRTGGALTDLHIHDTDFVCWCLGRPAGVSSMGSINHVTTQYQFSNGPDHVVAQGGWGHANGFPFTMRYVALFERATAVFDLSAANPVSIHHDGQTTHPELPSGNGYEIQAAHVIDAVLAAKAGKSFELRATMADAVMVAEVLEAERRSLSRA